MELAKYKACICEGAAENAIMDILLDEDLLVFSREEMLEESVIRCRDGKKFEQKYLRKGFAEKISVIRILDSRREKFKVSLKNEVLFKAETMHAAPKGTACGDVSTRAATQRTVFIPIYQLFFWKWLNVIPKLARPWVTERRFVEKPNIFAIGACA